MAQPIVPLEIWAEDDVNLPATGEINKERPLDDLWSKGYDLGEKPAAEEFNYVLNMLSQWLKYISGEGLSQYLPINGTKVTLSGDLAGNITFSGNKEVTSNIQVVDNSHSHTSANISDATAAGAPNTIVRRDSGGAATIGRAVFITANDSSNADLFFQNSAGTKVGSVNYSQSQNLMNIYYDNGNSTPLSFITLRSDYVEIYRPRSASGQGGEPNALVRFDYLGTQLSNTNSAISSINSDLQSYKTYASNSYVSDIRLGSTYTKVIPAGGQAVAETGGVMVGWLTEGANPSGDTIYFKPVQKYIGGEWYTVGQL